MAGQTYNQILYDIHQADYQIYHDDAALNNATPAAPINTATSIPLHSNARIRIEIKNNDTSFQYTTRYLLEMNINNSGWQPVTNTTPARITNSTHFNDGDPTTKKLGNEPFTQGEGIETYRASQSITLNPNTTTEIEWNILFTTPLTIGSVVQFRVVGVSDTPTDPNNYIATTLLYDNYPTITISEPTGGSNTMAETVANLTLVGIAIASDPTKAYKAAKLLDIISLDLQQRQERTPTLFGRGSLAPRRALTRRAWVEGNLEAYATPNHILYLLLLAGYPQTTTGTTPPYTHTITWGAGLPTKSGTIVAWHTNSTPPYHHIFAGLAARRIALRADAEANEPLTLSLELIGTIYGIHNTNTLTDLFTSNNPPADGDDPFVPQFATLETPNGTTTTRFINANIDFSFERDLRWTIRGKPFARNIQPIRSIRITGNLTATFEDDTDLQRFLNQTSPTYPYKLNETPASFITSLKLAFSNNQTGTNLRSFEISLPNITYTELSHPIRAGEIVTLNIGFEALYNAASSAAATLTIKNAAPATEYQDATTEISPNLNI